MLDKVDLKLEMDKKAYNDRIALLHPHLYDLQQKARKAEIPTVIVFEGWDAAGKGTCISSFLEWLDPRWFKVSSTYAPLPEEMMRPPLWRFWLKLPNYGESVIFDRSWYGRVLGDRVEGHTTPEKYERAFVEIRQFEDQIVNDRYVLLKFWLHISKKEQKKRLKAIEEDPKERWKITSLDLRNNKLYDEYFEAAERMLVETSTHLAPWTIVEATCLRFARIKIAEAIIAAIEGKLNEKGAEYTPLAEREKIFSGQEAVRL